MTPSDQAKFDQATAALSDMLPTLWRGIYQGCINQGFTPEQSMELLIAYIATQAQTTKGKSEEA